MALTDLYVDTGYWGFDYAVGDIPTLPFTDLQAIAPSAVIELFELQLNVSQHGVNETYRFHAGSNLDANGQLVWNGASYLRFPIEAEGFEYTGKGTLPRPLIRCSNIFGTITALIIGLPSGLEGAKVTRIRTLARYLDAINFPGGVNPYGTPDPTAEFPREVYYVDRKTNETRDVVELELAAAFDLAGVRAPRRQCISNICQWVYKSTECSYTPIASFTGTYSRTTTTVTVTSTAHGLLAGEQVYLNFTSGTAVSGSYTVVTAAANTFTVTTTASSSTSGNVTATQWYDSDNVPVYVSTSDTCAKRLNSCQTRFGANNELPFGSYPGIGTYFT
jgi:lambda family phage minor tail protein L